MATFKIHLDDEPTDILNVLRENKSKVLNVKRIALGPLSNNAIQENNRVEYYGPKDNDDVPKPMASKSTGCSENIKALDIQEKQRVRNSHLQKLSLRSPLGDLSNKPKDLKGEEITESPMSVDDSPFRYKRNQEPKSQDVIDCCDIYKEDIYDYLRKIEDQFRPKAYYMRRQPDINYSMRTILVDWLVEVGEEYKLRNETVFMAISFVDRFLSCMAVARPKLQLLGTSSMFVAAKFEEIYPPEVGEFNYITDDSYTVKQVLRMERLILKVLNFDLSCPTSYTFVMHVASCSKLAPKLIYLAMYVCELTLLEGDPYLDFCPSLVACGAIALARRCLDYVDIWPATLTTITGYEILHLVPLLVHLNETHSKSFTSPHTAINEKYKSIEYHRVSQIPHKKLILRDMYHPPQKFEK